MRTTSTLEAYNGVLGKRIIPKGNFFKFIKTLQQEEDTKNREFGLLVDSGGASASKKKKKVKSICCLVDVYSHFF